MRVIKYECRNPYEEHVRTCNRVYIPLSLYHSYNEFGRININKDTYTSFIYLDDNENVLKKFNNNKPLYR